MKILVCDPISPKGIALLQQRPEFKVVVLTKRLSEDELLPLVGDAVAMVVRSETKVSRKVIEAAPKLRVVGRAGVGVDNVDVEAATQQGVVVMNTPGGNTTSTAELSFAMLLLSKSPADRPRNGAAVEEALLAKMPKAEGWRGLLGTPAKAEALVAAMINERSEELLFSDQ